ncbi:hypothetical protein GHT09_011501 [Marmota monax]|uniref:Peptidase S8 pro-domain domain-containing protein n=1 Tax=Marmota monax TaxID=9995 RepID=A0A834QHS0_MARMO|nr:hypothetical protein GHT09_011501 [Marmota monax]
MKGGCGSQWKAAAGLLFCVMVFASAEKPVFTNHFLVELHKGGEEEARQVAAEHGFGVRKVKIGIVGGWGRSEKQDIDLSLHISKKIPVYKALKEQF